MELIPGNLVVANGIIISQSATELSAYRSLERYQQRNSKTSW